MVPLSYCESSCPRPMSEVFLTISLTAKSEICKDLFRCTLRLKPAITKLFDASPTGVFIPNQEVIDANSVENWNSTLDAGPFGPDSDSSSSRDSCRLPAGFEDRWKFRRL